MHRKSAYILFLAVLGLLVIGIVMLFSTSAFARDSHGDVYFFIKRQAIWFGIGLAVCILAALIDYHFWQRTWCMWIARLDWSRPDTFSALGTGETGGNRFPCCLVCPARRSSGQCSLRTYSAAC